MLGAWNSQCHGHDLDDTRQSLARLHVAVTRLWLSLKSTVPAWPLSGSPAERDLREGLAHLAGTPDGQAVGIHFLEELAWELTVPSLEGDSRFPLPVEGRGVRTPVLFVVKATDQPILGTLHLQKIAAGSGILYPAPSLAGIRDSPWREAERAARRAVAKLDLWPLQSSFDVRWEVVLQGNFQPSALDGPSAGAAFALALAWLFAADHADPLWRNLDLGGFAVTAALDRGDPLRLVAIGSDATKLAGAARDRSFPRLAVVALEQQQLESWRPAPGVERPEEQRTWGEIEAPYAEFSELRGAVLREKGREFFLLGAKTLPDLAHRLTALHRARYGEAGQHEAAWLLFDSQEPPPDAFYQHRSEIDALVDSVVAGGSSGAIAIFGEAGTGKTTWTAARCRLARERGDLPVSYFIPNISATIRETIARSLYFQLRRKYALPAVATVAVDKPAGTDQQREEWTPRLKELLKLVSQTLPLDEHGRRRPEIIFVEAADQTGPAERLWAGLAVPDNVPDGIWFVFTTRPDERWRAQPLSRFHFLSACPIDARGNLIDPQQRGYRDALRRYFAARNSALPAERRLDDALIERIFSAADPPIFNTVREGFNVLANPGATAQELALWREAGQWLLTPDERAGQIATQLDQHPDALAAWTVLGVIEFGDFKTPLLDSALTDLFKAARAFERHRDLASLPAELADASEEAAAFCTRILEGGRLGALLGVAASYFHTRPLSHTDLWVCKLAHPSYGRFIRQKLGLPEQRPPAPTPTAKLAFTLLAGAAHGWWLRATTNDSRFRASPPEQSAQALAVLPRLLGGADRWDDLATLLCDFDFPLEKIRAGLGAELMADFATALETLPENAGREADRRRWADDWEKQLLDCAAGRLPRENLVAPSSAVTEPDSSPRSVAAAGWTREERLEGWGRFYYRAHRLLATPGEVPLVHLALQLAVNSNADGPVADAARALIEPAP
jgi:hypothetical protein